MHGLAFGLRERLTARPPSDRRTVVPHWLSHPGNMLCVFDPPQTRPPSNVSGVGQSRNMSETSPLTLSTSKTYV
jgi:hypothetical protein